MHFAVELYRTQLAAGRHFLHEHPPTAASWRVPEVGRLLKCRGVANAEVSSGMRVASSSPEVLKKLAREASGLYPPGLCRAILQGIEAQTNREGQRMPRGLAQALAAGRGLFHLGKNEEGGGGAAAA